MVVDNHEYYQTDGAQRPRGSEVRATTGSRTRLGEPVLDDMSSRTGSANFFKKIIFRLLKFFLRHPTEYAVLAATTNGAQVLKRSTSQEGEKSCNATVVDNHEYYQTGATVLDRKRLADPGEPERAREPKR
jgi:hypothetical protein